MATTITTTLSVATETVTSYITSAASSTSTSTSTSTSSTSSNPPSYKIVGIVLAVSSGFFIGFSFVVKKKGLISSTAKSGNAVGEGHAYLKSWLWWTGMTIMILGELCNFAAFAFTEAILVTPLGALSVVVSAIASSFFLKETLSFFGWIGCTLCIFGAVILALNAPEQQSVSTITAFQKLFLSPGFLVWGSLCIVASLVLAFWAAPKWGKKNMFVYITICSLIGGLSVSTLQGLGASILTSIRGDNQFKHWFIYIILVFVTVTLLTEINYLNSLNFPNNRSTVAEYRLTMLLLFAEALELFNTSMVTPTYYILFTSATMISSFILYQGLKASAVSLITMVLGFLVTCLGITLLQMSKVDPKQFEGTLDRRSTMLLTASKSATENADHGDISAIEEPGMDALRGGFGTVGSIIRVRSARRNLSSASSMTPYNWPARGSATSAHGLETVPRYKLSDNPMPEDAQDQISMHSSSRPPLTPSSARAGHLKFDDRDVVHQYDPKRQGEAIHSSRMHSGSSADVDPYRPNPSSRQNSGASQEFTTSPLDEHPSRPFTSFRAGQVSEKPFQSGAYTAPPIDRQLFPDGMPPPQPYFSTAHRDERAMSHVSSKHSLHSLMDRFGSSDLPDLRLGKRSNSKEPSDERKAGGGAHRYPHLPKSAVEQENEEREALVRDGSEDEEGDEGSGGDLGENSMVDGVGGPGIYPPK